MLDMKTLRGNVEEVKRKLQHRGEDLGTWINLSSWIKGAGNDR